MNIQRQVCIELYEVVNLMFFCYNPVCISVNKIRINFVLPHGSHKNYNNVSEQSNPIQSNVNKRVQVFLFARIFYNITFTYKLKHLRFQLTRNKNCKEHLDQASVCLDDF